MRLVSFGAPGAEVGGVLVGTGVVPLRELGFGDRVGDVLRHGRLAELRATAARIPPDTGIGRDTLRLGPPLPDAGQIVCVGLNYRAHAEEQGQAWPEAPLLFGKAPGAMTGCRDPIELPLDDADTVDYEVELVAVIGRRARRVAPGDALDHVAGYMVGNDVSARRWQKHDGQWFRAKSCDTFFPCGPALVTADEVGDYRRLRLHTTIDGERLQDATAEDMIHDLPAVIAHLSRSTTLHPGDLIATGTPAGVGCYRQPRRFLRPGDRVRCAIDGLGTLDNPVVGASA